MVELHALDGAPEVQLDDFDHVVEGSFTSPTGQIAVMGCTDFLPDAPRLEIQPGSHQFMYLVSGARTIQTEWEPADDLYSLYIWPAERRALHLMKQWKPGRLDSGL
jgi:hypothetical protein